MTSLSGTLSQSSKSLKQVNRSKSFNDQIPADSRGSTSLGGARILQRIQVSSVEPVDTRIGDCSSVFE